jgi:hypothetical protein
VSVLRCVEHEQVIGIAAIDEIAATSARQFLNLVDVSDPARLARRCPIGRGRKCRAFLESGVIAKSRVWTWSVLLHLRSSVSVRSQHHNPVRIAPMSWMGHLVVCIAAADGHNSRVFRSEGELLAPARGQRERLTTLFPLTPRYP